LDGAKVQRNAGVPSRGAEPGRERGHDGQRPLALLYIAMDPPLPPPISCDAKVWPRSSILNPFFGF
jgi:hypothetical protein